MASQRSLSAVARNIGFGVAGLLLVTSAPVAAETTNPRYEAWAGFQPGARVTHEERSELSGTDALLAPDGVALKVVTYTLVEISAERAVVQTAVTEQDFLSTIELAPTRITFPAKVKKAHIAAINQVAGVEEGEEACDVLGKPMTCKTVSGKLERGETSTDYKTWRHDKVPGGIVKQVRTSTDPQGSVTTTVTLHSYTVTMRAQKGS